MKLELSEEQTRTLCVLMQEGVKSIAAQIAHNGLNALESGASILSDCNALSKVVSEAIAAKE